MANCYFLSLYIGVNTKAKILHKNSTSKKGLRKMKKVVDLKQMVW